MLKCLTLGNGRKSSTESLQLPKCSDSSSHHKRGDPVWSGARLLGWPQTEPPAAKLIDTPLFQHTIPSAWPVALGCMNRWIAKDLFERQWHPICRHLLGLLCNILRMKIWIRPVEMYKIPWSSGFSREILWVPQSIAHSFGAGNQKLTLAYSPYESSSHSSLKTALWWQELCSWQQGSLREKNGFASSLLLVVSDN